MPRKEVTYCQGWNFLVSFSLDFTKKRNDGKTCLWRHKGYWLELYGRVRLIQNSLDHLYYTIFTGPYLSQGRRICPRNREPKKE